MQFSVSRLLHFFSITVAFLFAVHGWADACGDLLTFKEIDRRSGMAIRLANPDTLILDHHLSAEALRNFWQLSVPALKQRAAADGSTLSAYLSESFTLLEMVRDELGQTEKQAQVSQTYFASVLENATALEYRHDNTPLSSSEWQEVASLYGGVFNLGIFASYLEQVSRSQPSFNPYEFLSPAQVEHIFDILETDAMEQALRIVKDKAHPRVLIRPQIETATLQALLAKPKLQSDGPRTLNEALRANEALKPGISYQVTLAIGRTIHVILSDEITDAYNAVTTDSHLSRLLKSIGYPSGLKSLIKTGPGIVEVKAVMRGPHWRIIGCLQGDKLRLLRVLQMGSSLASYTRTIPHNLCE